MPVVAYTLIAVGGLLSLLNWGTLITSLRRRRAVSAIPLIGAVPLALGIGLLPEWRRFAWLAIPADYGTLILILMLPRIAFDMWSTSGVNIVHRFTFNADGRLVVINLFRRGIAVIRVEFDPPAPCDDRGGLVVSFGLVGTWVVTDAGFAIAGYASDRQLDVRREDDRYVTVESNAPTGRNESYISLDKLVLQKQA